MKLLKSKLMFIIMATTASASYFDHEDDDSSLYSRSLFDGNYNFGDFEIHARSLTGRETKEENLVTRDGDGKVKHDAAAGAETKPTKPAYPIQMDGYLLYDSWLKIFPKIGECYCVTGKYGTKCAYPFKDTDPDPERNGKTAMMMVTGPEKCPVKSKL